MAGMEPVFFLKHYVFMSSGGGGADFKIHKHINPKHALTHLKSNRELVVWRLLKSQ